MIPYPLRLVLVAAAFAPVTAGAQSGDARGNTRPGDARALPERYRPPPGMCRVWVKDVPPDRQPAPTDCASALRNKPSNATVYFSDPLPLPKQADSVKRPGSPPATARARRDSTAGAGQKADSVRRRGDTIPPSRER
jgi:hypothetical protein